MKKDKVARRYSESTVKHRKNFPRTLNKFAQQWDKIDVSYNKDSATFHCYDTDSKIFDNDNSNKVYDKNIADIRLMGLEYIEEVIESLFEYKKYQGKLLLAIENFILKQVMSDGSVKKISWLFAQDKERDDLLAKLHYHFEEVTGGKFSARFILMMYSSIKNKLMFKPIYLDSEGNYLTYFSSQFSDYKPPTYMDTLMYEIRVVLKTYVEYSKIFTYAQAKEYAYYLNCKDGVDFEENSSIVNEWKERYYFLISNGLDELFFLAVQSLCNYIEPFSTQDGNVVSFMKKGTMSKRNMKIHLFMHSKDKKYDETRLFIMHKALNKVVPLDLQEEIYLWKDIPRFRDFVKDI